MATASMLLAITGCLPSQSVVVVQRLSSAENTAILSKRDSGAPSRGSTLVRVRLNSVPNYVAHGTYVLGLTGNQIVTMKWITPRHLALSCNSCIPQDVNYEVTKVGDVVVTYDAHLTVP